MDPEKLPLLSKAEDAERDEKKIITDDDAASTDEASGTDKEQVCKDPNDAGKARLPLLVPLKTQIAYWTASASTVALSQLVRRIATQHVLVGPVLLLTVAVCLIAITLLHQQGRPWWSTRASWTFVVGLVMLLVNEVVYPLRRSIEWARPMPPSPFAPSPLTIPQQFAIRFCLAYVALEFIDIFTRTGSHLIIPDDGSRGTIWCAPPYFTHIGVQAVWTRHDKIRGIRHGALAWAITYALARIVAYSLEAPSPVVGFTLWGAECLGDTNAPSQLLLLRPMHVSVIWLCDRILYEFGKFVRQEGGGGS